MPQGREREPSKSASPIREERQGAEEHAGRARRPARAEVLALGVAEGAREPALKRRALSHRRRPGARNPGIRRVGMASTPYAPAVGDAFPRTGPCSVDR